RQRLVQLLGGEDAELQEGALGHRPGPLGQPEVVPDEAPPLRGFGGLHRGVVRRGPWFCPAQLAPLGGPEVVAGRDGRAVLGRGRPVPIPEEGLCPLVAQDGEQARPRFWWWGGVAIRLVHVTIAFGLEMTARVAV